MKEFIWIAYVIFMFLYFVNRFMKQQKKNTAAPLPPTPPKAKTTYNPPQKEIERDIYNNDYKPFAASEMVVNEEKVVYKSLEELYYGEGSTAIIAPKYEPQTKSIDRTKTKLNFDRKSAKKAMLYSTIFNRKY
ncbi:MAG: hypothetical protein NW207_11640 [Cytophagales bacterium]|nr:hypothetical protein [Cytophagales bacterium]